MTLVEFNENLNKIDFTKGRNIQKLEDYLLGCLAQLNLYKNDEPTYELFLLMFDQARNGKKEYFDPVWMEMDESDKRLLKPKYDNSWEGIRNGLRSLTADLIKTRKIRGNSDAKKTNSFGEWKSEGGIRFYNGTTPNSILKYAATRFEGEYQASAFQEHKVTWKEFNWPIWVGISYE